MSSTLPVELRNGIIAAARVPDGRVQCAECGQLFAENDIQVDHITPEADGGSHDPLNLQCLCAPKAGAGCHRLKSRREAKTRAARARAGEGGGAAGPLAFAAAAGTAGGISGWATWLTLHDQPVRPFLGHVEHWMHLGLAGVGSVGLLAALAHAGQWTAPDSILARPTPAGAETVAEKPLPLDVRVKKALGAMMGEEITVRAEKVGFRVSYGDGFADHEDNARLKVTERVNAKLGGRWLPAWDTEHDRVTFVPRPQFPNRSIHPGLPAVRPWHVLPIADDIEIDLKVTSHVLIIGRTNSGKTSVMRSCVIAAIDSANRNEVESILLDPKRVELVGFRGWAGVRGVMTTDDALWTVPLRLKAEMDERHRAFEEDGVPLSAHSPIIVVVDEYEQYVVRMNDYWQQVDPDTGKPRKRAGERVPPPVQAIASLLATARKCGIHLIIGTQRPDASWFGGTARDNCQARIGVGPLSAQAARMLFERGDIGRDLPADAKGRCTVQLLDGDFVEAQAWWVPDPSNADGKNTDEDWQILTRLKGVAA